MKGRWENEFIFGIACNTVFIIWHNCADCFFRLVYNSDSTMGRNKTSDSIDRVFHWFADVLYHYFYTAGNQMYGYSFSNLNLMLDTKY